MSDRDWRDLTDRELDAEIENTAPEIPPEGVVESVSPCGRALARGLTGISLVILNLNFLGLNYILPAIGAVLSILGFRVLRRENRWFAALYVITLVQSVYLFCLLMLNATVYCGRFGAMPVSQAMGWVSAVLTLVRFLCLWRGIRAVREKAGFFSGGGSGAALIIWYVLLCFLAYINYSGIIVPIGMIVAYILIIRSIYKLYKEMEKAGYSVRAAAVRVSDRVVAISAAAVLAVGIICGYLFFGSYPMDWQEYAQVQTEETEAIKAHLAELGFPEDILEDLTEEDLLDCRDAEAVEVAAVCFYRENGENCCYEGYENDIGGYVNDIFENPINAVRYTDVRVRLSGETERWKIFNHFRWNYDPGFCGTEVIQIMPAFKYGTGWVQTGGITGHVMYDADGETYAAPYYSCAIEEYTSVSMFGGSSTSEDIFAEFSPPGKGENHRGYVSYSIQAVDGGVNVNTAFYYTYQESPVQYPVMTAKEKQLTGISSDYGVFKTVADIGLLTPGEIETTEE